MRYVMDRVDDANLVNLEFLASLRYTYGSVSIDLEQYIDDNLSDPLREQLLLELIDSLDSL